MNNRNNIKNRKRNNKRAYRQGKVSQQQIVSVLNSVKSPGISVVHGPFPQFELIKYFYTFTENPAGAFTFQALDFRANSVWQPLVGGATGTLSGYSGSAARYASSRVESLRFRFRVANNEAANSISFGVIGNDTQPSTVITTYQQALTAIGSSRSFVRDTVGFTSGMSIYRSQWFRTTPGSLVGDPMMVLSDRDFSAPFGANPNQIAWLGFVVLSESAGVNITAGCYVTMEIEYRARNFGPLLLA